MIFKALAKDTMVYGLGEMMGRIATFISFPIIATVLSAKSFGMLDLMLTSGTLVGIFIGCGLNNAISRCYWDEDTLPEERKEMVSTGLLIQVVVGLVITIIAILLIPYIYQHLKEEYDVTFRIVVLFSIIALVPLLQWVQYIRDIVRMQLSPWRFAFMSTFSKVLAALFGVIAVVLLKKGIEGFILAQLLSVILVAPIGIWFIKENLTLNFSYKWMKILLQYGLPFIYVGLAYWIFGSIDRWMLASMSSVEETGIYSIAARFASIVLFVSMAFGQAWSPNAIKIKADNPDKYRAIYAKVLLVLLYVMLITGGGVALFSKEAISIILPDEYLGAAMPMAILCFSIIIQSTQQVTGVGISLERKTKIFGYMAWLTAFINVALNFIFIPNFGASGAAMATLFSYFILTMGYFYFTNRFHPLPFSLPKISWLVFLGSLIAVSIYKLNPLELSFGLAFIKLLILTSITLLGAIVFKQDILNAIKKTPLKQ